MSKKIDIPIKFAECTLEDCHKHKFASILIPSWNESPNEIGPFCVDHIYRNFVGELSAGKPCLVVPSVGALWTAPYIEDFENRKIT